MKGKERNELVDVIRGFAMLMVVLGHTMSGCLKSAYDSFLFQIIWSLQMPLFFLISGYVTRYSSKITTVSGFCKFVKKRSLSYLLPWVVWTFFVRGFMLDQSSLFDIKHLLWNMDTSYWFLVSIWFIAVIIFGVPNYICSYLNIKSLNVGIFVQLVGSGIMMCILGAIGLYAGISFLAIKLTLYYSPIYLLGYIFGKYQNKIEGFENSVNIINSFAFISAILWFYLILHINFYYLSDTLLNIATRYIASITGCIFAIYCLYRTFREKGKLFKLFSIAGEVSLEIYLIHNLLLVILKPTSLPSINTIYGAIILFTNYSLTVGLSLLLIYLIKKNTIMNKFLFYKTKELCF